MGIVVRKPAFWVCKEGYRPAWASAQSDQCLLLITYWKVPYTALLLSKFQGSLCSLADLFGSSL